MHTRHRRQNSSMRSNIKPRSMRMYHTYMLPSHRTTKATTNSNMRRRRLRLLQARHHTTPSLKPPEPTVLQAMPRVCPFSAPAAFMWHVLVPAVACSSCRPVLRYRLLRQAGLSCPRVAVGGHLYGRCAA